MISIPISGGAQPSAPAQPQLPLQLKPVVYFTKFQSQPQSNGGGAHPMHRPPTALMPALVYDTRPGGSTGTGGVGLPLTASGGQNYGTHVTPLPPLVPMPSPPSPQQQQHQLQPQSNFNNIKVMLKISSL